MLVMLEIFDEWERTEVPEGSGRFFRERHEGEIAAVVRRDRNHPSVILWSIGNEIPESFARPDIGQHLRESVRSHDATRPVTAGICQPWWENESWLDWPSSSDPAFEYQDVAGYNYQWANYEPDHERVPQRVIVGAETFPKDIFDGWMLVEKHPWVIGDFVWTAADYLGESSIGQTFVDTDGVVGFTFPFHMAVCGDLDLLGRRKPQSYYREAIWRSGVLHMAVHQPLLPGQREQTEGWSVRWGWPLVQSHWTWPGHEEEILKVSIYSSCERVRLFLNGRDLGEKPTTRNERYQAEFEVPYVPGELRVVGTIHGQRIEHVLRTAGRVAALQLTPDRTVIRASRNDLAFVDIGVVDENGIPVPSANNSVRVTVSGAGELAAIGNANPVDIDSFRAPERRAWRGWLQAIVRPGGTAGAIILRAEAESLVPVTVSITTI
jgi:beta-galactosidase